MKGIKVSLPKDVPKVGEVFRHYKGDYYKVFGYALHSNDGEWMIVYEPQYENPDAPFFTRPLREWDEVVEWNGEKIERFKQNI